MKVCIPKFFDSSDARRYATDLMQLGDDGPHGGDNTEEIEAALKEATRLLEEEESEPGYLVSFSSKRQQPPGSSASRGLTVHSGRLVAQRPVTAQPRTGLPRSSM